MRVPIEAFEERIERHLRRVREFLRQFEAELRSGVHGPMDDEYQIAATLLVIEGTIEAAIAQTKSGAASKPPRSFEDWLRWSAEVIEDQKRRRE